MSESTPPQKTTLAPLLSVRRGVSAIEFYKNALGAEIVSCIKDDQGDVVAHLSVEGADFWLADEAPQHANFSPESLSGSSVRLVLTVADPDSLFKRAIAAGAKIVYPLEDQSYGWRIGRFVDPFGHHWEVGRPLSRG